MPAPDQESLETPAQWGEVLRRHGHRFAAARHHYRQAQLELQEGNPEAAMERLEQAAVLDPSYHPPHFTRARLYLRSANPLAITEALEGLWDMVHGFRAQAWLAANALIAIDLILAGTLLWLALILLLRYLPFLHHQLRGRLEGDGHLEGRGILVWIAVLAMFFAGLGIVPTLALALVVVWLYGGRRERVVLGMLVCWFAIQGLAGGVVGTVLNGADANSRTSLAYRAGHEVPSSELAARIQRNLSEHPDDPDLRFAQGLVRGRNGSFSKSIESFQKSLDLRPNVALTTANLASNHYYRGDYERAVAGFQRAAVQDSTLGTTHYNLAQAYIKKLFFREGGAAMQRASAHGFVIGSEEHRLPPGAVYFQHPTTSAYWRQAWNERGRISFFDMLWNHAAWLGVPPDHVGFWLLGMLLLAMGLKGLLPRERLVFECANCGVLACPVCSGEHDGSVLCTGCFGTAARAKSELVLGTLLRNRRRATEVAFLNKVRGLNSWAFGAGEIYNGLRKRGVLFALLLSAFAVGTIWPGMPLRDLWRFDEPEEFGWERIASATGLVALFVLARYGRSAWRTRQFHLHPSSMVRLTDLMDGRSERKLKV